MSDTGLRDLAEELDSERAPASSLGIAHAFLCLVADFDPATTCPPALHTVTVLATTRKCSHGHVHDEFAQYHLLHEVYGPPCNADLKRMLQHKVVKGALIIVKFPPKPFPCAACLQVNTIASRVLAQAATHIKAA
jgi:hypothetical protein